MEFDVTHRYSQQASRLTQTLFNSTSVLTVLFVILAVWQSWWWLVGVAAIVIFWGIYTLRMRTVPVYDITASKTMTVGKAAWQQFKETHPTQVAKNGARK